MKENVKQLSLDELRNGSVNSYTDVIFRKKNFGGIDPKEVSEYIRTLKERLNNAEVSFKERLEEYSEMTAMLTQERDKYLSMFKACESTNLDLQQQLKIVDKDNEALNIKIQGMSIALKSQDDGQKNEKIELENAEMQNKINEYKEYKDESIDLKNQLNQLKAMVQDLNEEIENCAKNDVSSEEYENIIAENQIIKQKYDEAVYERGLLLAEKNILTEQNSRISTSLVESNEKNKELRNINTTTKLNTRKMIVEFETKAYECAQNHRKNIDQISENIKSTLNILHYENMDIANLISSPYEKFNLELDDADVEVKSSTICDEEGLEAISALTASMEEKLLSKTKY
ncbi:MAG: hypothetical protein JJE18_06140 [Eubacteriaceae bacterium]|nr:hypothetical protein [Eubacteriaceae bacterium]